ncbi:MAG: zinc transporter ZupT [Promethearchaeota archaeon]
MIFQETVISFDVIIQALILTSFAGLATSIGAAFAFLTEKPSIRILAMGLGFSGGVMLAVSFVELLPNAIEAFSNEGLVESDAFLWGNIWFFIGIFTIFLIDIFIPHFYKEEEDSHSHELSFKNSESKISKNDIRKIGLLTALGIAVHNFPEGLVTFTSTLQSVELGIVLAIAVGLHNIPEGLSISIPIVTATGDKWQAFKLGTISGLAEPVGAFIAAIILFPFLSPAIIGASLAFVAGIMVFISFDELLPAAKNADESHFISLGIIAGMIVMVLTLWLFT